MSSQESSDIRILFSRAHGERLTIVENREENCFSELHHLLIDNEYAIESTEVDEHLLPERLSNYRAVVLGAPEVDLLREEKESLEQFVREGGALLVIIDSGTVMMSLPVLKEMLVETAGLHLHEYHHHSPTYLHEFWPHYVTAGIDKVQIGEIAFFEVEAPAKPLARTRATGKHVMACASVGRGRVVAAGALAWLTDDLLKHFDNEKLATNLFHWLAGSNPIDIECLEIPGSVRWGESAAVVLQLRSNEPENRLQVECILESDADALINGPARKRRSIPPDKTTHMRWNVQPQALGAQDLRLSIFIEGGETLYFDKLPPMLCLAPGYLTLEVKDVAEKRRTKFETGDYLTAEGAFHWSKEEEQPYHLELKASRGLLIRGHEKGYGIERWHLQAVEPGEHELTLRLAETGQSLPALVKVEPSIEDRLKEIQAAHVRPLDAEIAERLGQVDTYLSREEIQRQAFKLLSPEEFVKEVYAEKDVPWLQGVLAAIRREQYVNFELLDLFLTHFAPTYVPYRGTFIPYDPALGSELAKRHSADKWFLEYNLLQIQESEDMTIKQNVAAYLLHEKYGHGFFFTQTRLGQQIALLLRHGFFRGVTGEDIKEYESVAEEIRSSAIVVNEGFATWLELTFLDKLDREVRQAVYPRYVLLIQEATGLYARERKSRYFQRFPPRFDSPYREGFEYLDFIGRKLSERCAVRAFLIATHVELGIVENVQGHLKFQLKPVEIRELLFGSRPDGRSRERLYLIADLIRQKTHTVQELIKAQHCPTDCRRSGCPLEIFVEKELGWRISWAN